MRSVIKYLGWLFSWYRTEWDILQETSHHDAVPYNTLQSSSFWKMWMHCIITLTFSLGHPALLQNSVPSRFVWYAFRLSSAAVYYSLNRAGDVHLSYLERRIKESETNRVIIDCLSINKRLTINDVCDLHAFVYVISFAEDQKSTRPQESSLNTRHEENTHGWVMHWKNMKMCWV